MKRCAFYGWLIALALLASGAAVPDAAAAEYSGRTISIDLQDTDIHNFFRIISEVSGYNIVTSEDISGKLTLRLVDVPWDQCLDIVLRMHGLYQMKEGNVIMIVPVAKVKQLYHQ